MVGSFGRDNPCRGQSKDFELEERSRNVIENKGSGLKIEGEWHAARCGRTSADPEHRIRQVAARWALYAFVPLWQNSRNEAGMLLKTKRG
jgi:hypothetical protein